MLPKCESAQQVSLLSDYEVIALFESPLGALRTEEVMAERNVIASMAGAEDLVAGLGGNSSRRADGSYHDVARQLRSAALLAAKAYGKLALDSVYLDIADLAGLRAESDEAVAVGYDVKVAIHPKQLRGDPGGICPQRRRTGLGTPGAGRGAEQSRCVQLRGTYGRWAGAAACRADSAARRGPVGMVAFDSVPRFG